MVNLTHLNKKILEYMPDLDQYQKKNNKHM